MAIAFPQAGRRRPRPPRPRSWRASRASCAPEALIVAEDERRAFETDALTAYRRLPLAVVLPSTTAEVSAVLRFCHDNGVKVVPRGRRHLARRRRHPAGGRHRARRRQDEPGARRSISRTARRGCRPASPTSRISQAVAHEGFFYAPDPSSQLACTIAGNIAMNSGGAHCLKYGVTTNNLLGVTLVLLDGTVVEIGGEHLDSAGYDLLGLVCGSEGQLGVVTEAVVRILRAAEGARPALLGFDTVEAAGACVAAIIGAGIIPVAMEYMDRPAIKICEAFAHAGYPLDVEAMLIIEVEGSERGDRRHARPHRRDRRAVPAEDREGVAVGGRERRDLEGPQVRLRRDGPHLRLHLHGRHHPDRAAPPRAPAHRRDRARRRASASPTSSMPATATSTRSIMFDINKPGEMEKAERAGEEILKLCVEVGGCLTGEHGVGIEKRDLMRCQFTRGRPAQQMRVRGVFDPGWLLNPAKVFPLDGRVAA